MIQLAFRNDGVSRRTFLYRSIVGASALAIPVSALARPKPRRMSANEKLNLAFIGVGGRGAADMAELKSENVVALCDVNEKSLDAAAAKYPNARKLVDFRRLYDKSNDFDAVVVATTEHTH